MEECIFCSIIAGTSPCHTIWEDEKHIAFLSIFPNTPGVSVVIPKIHYPSYAFELPDGVLQELIIAAKKVGKLLDAAFPDVGRTGLVFEGFGVDHVHAKLFPLHGTATQKQWSTINSSQRKYFTQYEGYISSHDYTRADDEELKRIAQDIRKTTVK